MVPWYVFSVAGRTPLGNHHESMGDLQDPKVEVQYHIRPYFVGIFYIGLKHRPFISPPKKNLHNQDPRGSAKTIFLDGSCVCKDIQIKVPDFGEGTCFRCLKWQVPHSVAVLGFAKINMYKLYYVQIILI